VLSSFWKGVGNEQDEMKVACFVGWWIKVRIIVKRNVLCLTVISIRLFSFFC